MGLIQKAFSDIITFSRASNATRIGPTGRVEYAPHNLLTYSEQFDNAAWITARASVVANAVAAPNGTVTADKLVEDTTASNNHRIRQDISTSAIPYTFTVFCKAAERGYVALYNLTTLSGQVFDLITGTVGVVVGTAPTSASITSVGNGWYRCSITVTATAATNSWSLYILPSNTSTLTYTGDGVSGLYLWGAQLAVGPYPLDYTPTTSAAVYGPRFDFDPVTLAAKGLLIEESRTNLVTYSEQFNNAAWTKVNATVTANSSTAPDGTLSADLLVPTATSSDDHSGYQLGASSVTGTYTATCYIKAAGYNYAELFDGVGANRLRVNLSDGTYVVVGSPGSVSVSYVGNGWYRCSFTRAVTSASVYVQVGVSNANGTAFSGDGTSGILIWGAQLEAGSFATSLIPTLASTVTRSADVASVNTLSPWHNSVEGTLYAEGNFIAPTSSSSKGIATLVDNSAGNDSISIFGIASSNVKQEVLTGGASQASFTLGYSSNIKAATAYKANDMNAAVNGTTGTTDTSGTVPTVAKLQLGGIYNGTSFQMNGWLRRVAFYPRRLLDAELQALTA